MDVQQKLDQLTAMVEGARSMPMSASIVVNKTELMTLLAELREALPSEIAQAQQTVQQGDLVVEEARREAEQIVAAAHQERQQLISGTDIALHAQAEADRILGEARAEAEEQRREADDYVDSKLANFEVVLTKTLGAISAAAPSWPQAAPRSRARTARSSPRTPSARPRPRWTSTWTSSWPRWRPRSARPWRPSAAAATSCSARSPSTSWPTTWPPPTSTAGTRSSRATPARPPSPPSWPSRACCRSRS
ncbi:ATP synthase F0 subunit B [Streptacidiphilus monticola]